jgi:hypothetical protein
MNPSHAYEYIAQLVDAALPTPTGEEAYIDRDAFDGAPVPDLSDDYVGAPSPHEPEIFDVDTINRAHALLIMGSQAVVVMERPDGPVKDRVRFIKLDAFKALFANRHTEVLGAARKLTWAQAWLSHPRRREYKGIEFFPNPDGAKGVPGYLNLWRGFEIAPSPCGTYGVFNDHLLNNVCDSNPALYNYVFGWFAHVVQRPRERIGTALVLRGRMGSGKTKVGEVFGSLFPAHYFLVDDPRYVTGRFNSHMFACLLLQADEAVWAGDKAAEGRLKGIVTSEHQMIEVKGVDQVQSPNYVRLLMTSNEAWVVPAGKDERRFVVLDVNPRCAQNHEYFREMDAELSKGGRARLLYDLQRFDLGGVELRQIPRTAALLEQKLSSLDSVEDWWHNRLHEGTLTRSGDGWPDIIPVSALYADYVREADEIGIARKKKRSEFGLILHRLIPGLMNTKPRDDGKRLPSYALPPLDACRASFEERIGHRLDWPAGVAASEQAGNIADDDVVPL